MNKIKNILFTFIAFLLVQSISFAQDVAPPPEDFGGGDNPIDAAIDTHVWILLVVGLCFVFYKYKCQMK